MAISTDPLFPQLGEPITARLTFFTFPSGPTSYDWKVTGPGETNIEVTTKLEFPDPEHAREVEFFAEKAGIHEISVKVSIVEGQSPQTSVEHFCDDDKLVVNVRPQPVPIFGIPSARLRFSYFPDPSLPSLPQDDLILVDTWSLVDEIYLGTRTIDAGTAVSGSLRNGSQGVAAYIRITPRSGGRRVEVFSDSTGEYSARVPSTGIFDVLIVPQDLPFASVLLPGQTHDDLNAGYEVTSGDPVTIEVIDSGGNAVENALVAWATGQLVNTVVTTDADGTAAGFLRTSEGPLSMELVLPDQSSFPGLTLSPEGNVSVSPGDSLEVEVANIPTVNVTGTLNHADGSPYGNGQILFVSKAPLDNSGSLSVDGGSPVSLSGQLRRRVNADSAGQVSVELPRGMYDVVVVPTSEVNPDAEGASQFALDVLPGAPPTPPTWSLAPVEASSFSVSEIGGDVLEGIKLVATAQGFHGVGAQIQEGATSDAMGNATLELVDGMTYDLVVDPPPTLTTMISRFYADVVGGNSSVDIRLIRAVLLRGRLQLPTGEPAREVVVHAFCTRCTPGQVPDRPLHEVVTLINGEYTLRVPAPSVIPPIIEVTP